MLNLNQREFCRWWSADSCCSAATSGAAPVPTISR